MPLDIATVTDGVVTLRRMRAEEDAAALLHTWGDPSVMRHMASRPLESEAAARAFIEGIDRLAREGTLVQWGVEEAGELVGTATLSCVDAENESASLGYAVRRSAQGRGLGTRAAALACAHAFGALAVHRVEADVDPRNVASLRVLEKLGFTREGLLRGKYLKEGERQDAVILSLVRGDAAAPPL